MRDMPSLFQGQWCEGPDPSPQPEECCLDFLCLLLQNPPHKHPPKELMGKGSTRRRRAATGPEGWGTMDAPSARRAAPAPDTGRTFPGCRSCGGNSGIRSHLLPPAPEPNPGPPPLPDLPPLRECELNRESLASLPEKENEKKGKDHPPKETLPSPHSLPILQGVRISLQQFRPLESLWSAPWGFQLGSGAWVGSGGSELPIRPLALHTQVFSRSSPHALPSCPSPFTAWKETEPLAAPPACTRPKGRPVPGQELPARSLSCHLPQVLRRN